MIQKAERDAPKATMHENLAMTKMLDSCLTANRYRKWGIQKFEGNGISMRMHLWHVNRYDA